MEEKITIHVNHSVLIQRPAETVWDFTQDFSMRTTWDHAMLECTLLSLEPERKASIRARGGLTAQLEYKLFDRPHKTSLRMTQIHSLLVLDGGGSWSYEKQPGNTTLWTQSNTLTMKRSWVSILLKPFLKRIFIKNTIQSMNKAKQLLEQKEN